MKGTTVTINYVRDEDNIIEEEYTPDIKAGKEIKIKNMKNDSYNLYIGCELQIREENVENKFKGYIGDIIILNIKNSKDKNGIEFNKYLLNLARHYSNILSIFSENLEEFDFNNNIENDPNYLKYKEKIKEFNDNKLFKSIKPMNYLHKMKKKKRKQKFSYLLEKHIYLLLFSLQKDL